MGRKKKEEEQQQQQQQSHQEVQHSQTIPYRVYLHNKTRNNPSWLRASSPLLDPTAHCNNITLPLATRDNNTVCARLLHSMAGKRNLPLLDLDTKSLFTSYYYSIPGSSNAPATTFLQIAICHNWIADAPFADCIMPQSDCRCSSDEEQEGKRPYETSLAQWQ